ncbi:MAG: glycosyltransferase family 2 protein [Bacteroidota bacterium]
MLISVIIPTYNSESDLPRLLQSIQALQNPKKGLELIFVDNASTDRTASSIEQFIKKYRKLYYTIVLLKNTDNVGAVKALNRAINACSPDTEFIWKLDSDVELMKDSLQLLLNEFHKYQSLGAVVSNIVDPHQQETPVYSLFAVGLQKWTKTVDAYTFTSLPMGRHEKVIGLNGASILFPASVIRCVLGFDESFFLYYDDTDICYRIRKLGYGLACAKDSKVIHWTKNKEGLSAFRTIYYMSRSQMYFVRKHNPLLQRIIFYFIQVVTSPWRIFRICKHHNITKGPDILHTYILWWKACSDFVHSYNGVMR